MDAHWRLPAGLHAAAVRLPVRGRAAFFDRATGWLNSAAAEPAGLRGRKVVLVDFWTYTCINWANPPTPTSVLPGNTLARAW